jgi:hypothetical protein
MSPVPRRAQATSQSWLCTTAGALIEPGHCSLPGGPPISRGHLLHTIYPSREAEFEGEQEALDAAKDVQEIHANIHEQGRTRELMANLVQAHVLIDRMYAEGHTRWLRQMAAPGAARPLLVVDDDSDDDQDGEQDGEQDHDRATIYDYEYTDPRAEVFFRATREIESGIESPTVGAEFEPEVQADDPVLASFKDTIEQVLEEVRIETLSLGARPDLATLLRQAQAMRRRMDDARYRSARDGSIM